MSVVINFPHVQLYIIQHCRSEMSMHDSLRHYRTFSVMIKSIELKHHIFRKIRVIQITNETKLFVRNAPRKKFVCIQ